MSFAKTTRPRISRFTLVFLGLGICVFAWGLQYKLSLYYPAHASYHQVPEAKLLSKNEQPGTVAALRVVNEKDLTNAHVQASFMMLAALMLWLLPERRFIPALKKPWLAAAQASLDAFFSRPPPISA